MKRQITLTLEGQLLEQIERLRGREKRSTFVEHLVKLGLKAYREGKRSDSQVAKG